MKVVINRCFGGFSLSAKAIKRLAELRGRDCYFFQQQGPDGKIDLHKHWPIDIEDCEKTLFFSVFDIPNPNEVLPGTENWYEMSTDERAANNDVWTRHSIETRPDDRSDPNLIRVVEELGDKAGGAHAELKVVEIPDDVQYIIEEYDGLETIHEKHRSWS